MKFSRQESVVRILWPMIAALLLCGAAEHDPSGSPTPHPAKSGLHGRIEHNEYQDRSWERSFDEGQALYQSGKYDEAYKRWAKCLVTAQNQQVWKFYNGSQKIDVLKKLAMMYKTASKPADATKMYDLAMTTAIQTYGKESKPVADLMLEQGRVYTFYEACRNFSKADELLGESFRINEKLYGRMTIPTGDVAMALAQLKENEKLYDKAIEYWQLVIRIGDRLEPNVISCCRIGPRQGLARCYEQKASLVKAIDAHRDLIAMCRLGAKDMMPTVLNNYAACLMKAGRSAEAKAASDEAGSYSSRR